MSVGRYFNLLTNNYVTKKYPISLVHFVTNRCNARCSFCFIDFDDPKTFKGELTVDEIRKMSVTFGNSCRILILQEGAFCAKRIRRYIRNLYKKC